MNRSIAPILSLFFLLLAASADAAPKAPEKANAGRRAWFVQTSIPSDFENPVKVMAGGKIQILTLSNRLASHSVKVPEDGILRLVKEVPDPTGKEEVIYITLAKAVVPQGMNRALVIMAPVVKRKENGPVFLTKIQALNRFKGGDYMYINLTKFKIGVEIDDKKLVVKPGSVEIKHVAKANGVESVPYRYSYYHTQKKKWMTLNASMTILTRSRREIFIFGLSHNTGRIRCKGVTFPVEH